jgi:dolichyl-phosphate-mannose--protein O-mannosyl transferase
MEFIFKFKIFFNLILSVILGYIIYFHNYQYPKAPFWDENYHIPSAQKYLNHIFFEEPHPPLGKLLIALGQKLLNPNAPSDEFLDTNFAKDFPQDFDFKGYRFFPALLGWLTIVPIFLTLYILTKNLLLTWLGSSFYLFQNAFIVHFRGAMLDSIILFLLSTSIFLMLLVLNQSLKKKNFFLSIFLGVALGLLFATKVNTLVAIFLLVPFLIKKEFKKIFLILFLSIISYLSVWAIHFSLIQKNEPNKKFFLNLKSAHEYSKNYNKGVPVLNLCKNDENGSPWWIWPLGGRSINYRWETKGDGLYRYLYLQVNPISWWISSIAVLFSFFIIFFRQNFFKNKNTFYFYLSIISMIIFYYFGIAQVGRVMYLYHDFIPKLCAIFLVVLIIDYWLQNLNKKFSFNFQNKNEAQSVQRYLNSNTLSKIIIVSIILLNFITFLYYSPLTYYKPLSNQQVQARAFLPVFDLHCLECPREWIYTSSCNLK